MPGTVVGCVVSGRDGAPVPEASVRVFLGTDLLLSALTDAAGSFVFSELPPGDWVFAASTGERSGHSPRVVVFDDAATAVTIEVTELPTTTRRLRRRRGAPSVVRIEGTVRRGATGLPVENASVILAQGPGPAPDIAAVTDSQGAFSFSGLTPGRWLIRALDPDGEDGEVWADASAGDATVTVDIASSAPSDPE